MTLKNTWVTGETYAASDQNAIATQVNANTAATPKAGLFASRPAAGNLGSIYSCTDCDAVYQDNGTSWVKIALGDSGLTSAIGDVPTSGWTAVNMLGGSSWSASLDGMLFTAGASQTSFGYQYRAYPGSPFTLTTYIEAACPTYNNLPAAAGSFLSGVIVSDGTQIIFLGPALLSIGAGAPWDVGTAPYVAALRYANSTTFSSAYNGHAAPVQYLGKMPKWYRYGDDGTNRTLQFSFNGADWTTVVSETRTTFLTPTRIGVGVFCPGSGSYLMRLRSWNGVS